MATSAAGQGAVLARRCGGGCDGREEAAAEAMLQWQKVSDLLIAASLLSMPLELLYFATCAALAPLRRELLQLGTFVVMCGATHLLNVLAYDRPGSRRLLAALTAAKVLGALATSAAAVALPVLFPRLLRLKFRESLLRDKARQLGRDLAAVRRREHTVWRVVRAVTRDDADHSSLDARAVLRSTLLHLAAALGLSCCAVWMPAAGVLQLTHQLLADDDDEVLHHHHHSGGGGGGDTISVRDPDVAAVLASNHAVVLSRPGSELKAASCRSVPLAGAAAAIRIPNFHGNSSDTSAPTSYAILVLVLRAAAVADDHHRRRPAPTTTTAGGWSEQDLEVVQAVADQVAVALSHAAALEESQLIRHELAEQHGALVRARGELAAATAARDAAHSAMRSAVGTPMHAVVGLLSVLQQEAAAAATMRPEQRLVVDAVARTSAVCATLMDDVMETLPRMMAVDQPPLSPAAAGPAPTTPTTTMVSRRPFELRSLVRDAAVATRCLSGCRGLGFSCQLEAASSLPEWVVGDDKRVFHLVLHMVGALLGRRHGHGHVAAGRALSFSVCSCSSIAGEHQDWVPTPPRPLSFTGGNQVFVRFQIGLTKSDPGSGSSPASRRPHQCGISSPGSGGGAGMRLSFAMCKRIVEMMNGDMWWASESEGLGETMTCILRFQQHQPLNPFSPGSGTYRIGVGVSSAAAPPPHLHFNGLRILLADGDATSMEVTRKLLGRLGCQVQPVSSGADCLSLLGGGGGADPSASSFELVILDLDGHGGGAAAMDGFEVALRIRELSSTCWLLVLVAVEAGGVVDDCVRDMCRRAGVDGLIHKPVTLPALGAQLQRVLQNN